MFTSATPVDSTKTEKPPAEVDVANPNVFSPQVTTPVNAPPVNQAVKVAQGPTPEQLAKMDNKLEGNRPDVPNQSFGMYKKRENIGNLVAYA